MLLLARGVGTYTTHVCLNNGSAVVVPTCYMHSFATMRHTPVFESQKLFSTVAECPQSDFHQKCI